MKIKTTYVFPPIPDRRWDWCAYIDGQEEDGPKGHGRTKDEAITDLLTHLDEEIIFLDDEE